MIWFIKQQGAAQRKQQRRGMKDMATELVVEGAVTEWSGKAAGENTFIHRSKGDEAATTQAPGRKTPAMQWVGTVQSPWVAGMLGKTAGLTSSAVPGIATATRHASLMTSPSTRGLTHNGTFNC